MQPDNAVIVGHVVNSESFGAFPKMYALSVLVTIICRKKCRQSAFRRLMRVGHIACAMGWRTCLPSHTCPHACFCSSPCASSRFPLPSSQLHHLPRSVRNGGPATAIPPRRTHPDGTLARTGVLMTSAHPKTAVSVQGSGWLLDVIKGTIDCL